MNREDFESEFIHAEDRGDMYQFTSYMHIGKQTLKAVVVINIEFIERSSPSEIQRMVEFKFKQCLFPWITNNENSELQSQGAQAPTIDSV